MSRKTVNYEYRQEIVTYIINVAIILVFVMILIDQKSNLVLFPLTFLASCINAICNLIFTVVNRARNYGTIKGSKKLSVIKYAVIFTVSLVLFLMSAIVLW